MAKDVTSDTVVQETAKPITDEKSQNHKSVWVGRDLKSHCSNPLGNVHFG